mmetsp:Transcript_25945/g.74424  ORF Transcript_25945/g.74424 Transcript_25945/m.74424 type:complete len:136 (-) Transcript_25945:176-583(-)
MPLLLREGVGLLRACSALARLRLLLREGVRLLRAGSARAGVRLLPGVWAFGELGRACRDRRLDALGPGLGWGERAASSLCGLAPSSGATASVSAGHESLVPDGEDSLDGDGDDDDDSDRSTMPGQLAGWLEPSWP